MVVLLVVGLFCLSGALEGFRWGLLLLALGPVSQTLYWCTQLAKAPSGDVLSILLSAWSNPVFFWLLPLFLALQAKKKGRWLLSWGILAGPDSPLYLLDWCAQILALGVSLLLFVRRSAQRDTELQATSIRSDLAGE